MPIVTHAVEAMMFARFEGEATLDEVNALDRRLRGARLRPEPRQLVLVVSERVRVPSRSARRRLLEVLEMARGVFSRLDCVVEGRGLADGPRRLLALGLLRLGGFTGGLQASVGALLASTALPPAVDVVRLWKELSRAGVVRPGGPSARRSE